MSVDIGVRTVGSARSLMISPNLDALLEHEERAGTLRLELEEGLPPPPRKGSSVSRPSTSSSSASNPYINPAPTVLRGGNGRDGEVISHGQGSPDSRISISSTIYAPSSDSHTYSLYNDPPLAPDQHRSLFMQHQSPPASPIQFNTQLPTDTKPPIPTTPKPVFSRPSLRSRQSSPDENAKPKPATTNFLDVDERADLVRKSRKLARVFGQTPDADAMAHQDTGRSVLSSAKRHSPSAWRGDAFSTNRRHSMPLTPDNLSFISLDRPASPTSFIDLDDDPQDPPPSATEEDDDRRRKRERLAKLHRFLGSRVPASLVLGTPESTDSLPPHESESDDPARKVWLKRRRSSSAAIPSPRPVDPLDRFKADLDDREKAINVRRAQKMEKVFGVAPPQTLYHTRHAPTPSLPPSLKSHSVTSFLPIEPITPPPQSPKSFVSKKKKDNRPGTAESSKHLLAASSGFGAFDDRIQAPDGNPSKHDNRHSFIYSHYQHSLNSLNDIIDRDDRASLAELQLYLNDGPNAEHPPEQDGGLTPTPTRTERRLSTASSIKSERRRSLPARTSMISISSEYSAFASSPKADVTSFQVRRRRAAKLTQFFGVDYRDLINDVLESIETGVQTEERAGTLRAEEVEDLLNKLRNLKNKRTSLS